MNAEASVDAGAPVDENVPVEGGALATPETASLESQGGPLLSVVVTLVDGGHVMRRFLDAVTNQIDPPRLDIVLPYDDSVADVADFQQDYPDVRFLPLGTIVPERPIETAAGQHELYDRRRAAGLAAAKGDLIAILEDRGAPVADWAKTVVRLHEQPHGVIGGAIECAPGDLLNWAFYVCDFGRYGLPFESAPATWVSDVNVTYKRKQLEATRELWKERFREPVVHWALLEQGETLFLSSEAVVEHKRPSTTLGVLLPERFDWGRLFGHIRAMHMGPLKRAVYSLAGPVIPPMLLVRHGITQFRKGNFGRYLKAAPLALILMTFWTAGEVWGTITGKP